MGIRAFVVLVGVLFTSSAWADKPPPLEEAIKQAAAAHKPLVIEFGAQWCGPCKVFAARILPDGDVQKALEGVVFVRYDVDESPGDRAAAKLKIKSYPTFVVLDGKGVEVAREEGFQNVRLFVALVEKARREAVDERDIRAWLKEKPNDATNLMLAAQWFALHKHYDEAIGLFDKIAANKLATAAQRAQATAMLIRLRRMTQWKAQLAAEKVALVHAAGADATDDDILVATIGADTSAAETRTLIKAVLDAEADLARLNKRIYLALAAGAYDEALAAAKRLVAKRRSAQYLDTLAECYHARGDRKMALETEDEAIGFSRYDSILPTLERNRERFAHGGEESSIVHMRARAQDLWKRIDELDRLAENVETPEEREASVRERRDFWDLYMEQRRLAVAVRNACAKEAAGNEEAVARLVVEARTVKSAVLLLEPTATAALRDCLTKQLVGTKFDAEPKRPKLSLTITFVAEN